MDRARFEEPVTLLVGMGFPQGSRVRRKHTPCFRIGRPPASRARSIRKRCARPSSHSHGATTYWCLRLAYS
jgi:hypothetical protein